MKTDTFHFNHLQTISWKKYKQTKSVAFSLQENYTDWVTASEVSADFYGQGGVAWSAQRIPTAANLGFLDWSHYFFF
jgi:hypothetical protein